MDGEAIVSVSAAVVALVQLSKWSGVPDKLGPIAVLLLSALGVVLWGWSEGAYERTQTFEYFAGWVGVATSAAGIFGFTRSGGTALARMTAPPSTGAGSERSDKS